MGGEGGSGAGRKPRLRLCDAPPSRCRAVDAACPGRVRRRCQVPARVRRGRGSGGAGRRRRRAGTAGPWARRIPAGSAGGGRGSPACRGARVPAPAGVQREVLGVGPARGGHPGPGLARTPCPGRCGAAQGAAASVLGRGAPGRRSGGLEAPRAAPGPTCCPPPPPASFSPTALMQRRSWSLISSSEQAERGGVGGWGPQGSSWKIRPSGSLPAPLSIPGFRVDSPGPLVVRNLSPGSSFWSYWTL
ncbi:hypothetical protein VULLAG_LOCUS9633 [Vulpes lagopus]